MGVDIRLVGTPRLTWRRLSVLCNGLARDRSSLLWRDIAGDMADWDVNAQLLAAVEHGVRVLAWQKTEAATKRKDYPQPISPTKPEPEQVEHAVTPTALADFRARTRYTERGD